MDYKRLAWLPWLHVAGAGQNPRPDRPTLIGGLLCQKI